MGSSHSAYPSIGVKLVRMSELDRIMNVVNPEADALNEKKSRVRRKSKDLEDMMLDLVAPGRKAAFEARRRPPAALASASRCLSPSAELGKHARVRRVRRTVAPRGCRPRKSWR